MGAAWRTESAVPNSPMIFTPKPAAKCNGPVSPDMTSFAWFSTDKYTAKSFTGGNSKASGTACFSSTMRFRSRSLGPAENANLYPALVAN